MAVVKEMAITTNRQEFLLLTACLAIAGVVGSFIFAWTICLCCSPKKKQTPPAAVHTHVKKESDQPQDKANEKPKVPSPSRSPTKHPSHATLPARKEPPKEKIIPDLLRASSPGKKSTELKTAGSLPPEEHYFEIGGVSQLKQVEVQPAKAKVVPGVPVKALERMPPPPGADILETDQRYQTMVDVRSEFKPSVKGNVIISSSPKVPIKGVVSVKASTKKAIGSTMPKKVAVSMSPKRGTPSMAPVTAKAAATMKAAMTMKAPSVIPSMMPKTNLSPKAAPSMAPKTAWSPPTTPSKAKPELKHKGPKTHGKKKYRSPKATIHTPSSSLRTARSAKS